MPLAEFEADSFWNGTRMKKGSRAWVDKIVPGMLDVTPEPVPVPEPEPEPEPKKSRGRPKKEK